MLSAVQEGMGQRLFKPSPDSGIHSHEEVRTTAALKPGTVRIWRHCSHATIFSPGHTPSTMAVWRGHGIGAAMMALCHTGTCQE